MARRPIFVPKIAGSFVDERVIDFTWHAGFAVSQQQKSIRSLHAAAEKLGITPMLDISSKSTEGLGVQLSAFNLKLMGEDGMEISVECAFQGSKVFEHGGPYTDLYTRTSREAKTDERIRSSGTLTGFAFFNQAWPLRPATAFYDWLYLNALSHNAHLSEQLFRYHAFSDIAFNPEKSWNCQARSAALYVALHQRELLQTALSDQGAFINTVSNKDSEQQSLRAKDNMQRRLI